MRGDGRSRPAVQRQRALRPLDPGRLYRRGRPRRTRSPVLIDRTPLINRRLWAWAFYDFANSPYATTILSVVFNVYFVSVIALDAPVRGETLWAFLIAASTLVSGVLSPYLGALADIKRRRKRWLAVSAAAGAASTSALAFATPDDLTLTCALFLVSNVCFTLSLTFYHSFLNDLSTAQTIGRVSGFGWALGYIGGGLCLILNLIMIQRPDLFHIPAEHHWPARATFLVVGAWWLIFSLPLCFWLPESSQVSSPHSSPISSPDSSPAKLAWRRLVGSIKAARQFHKNLFVFLIAYLLYNDVIETVIVTASLFAASELGMGQAETVRCFLMIQFVAFFGALAFGRWADRWSNKKALQVTLVIWSLVLVWMLFVRTRAEFWAAGAVVALVLGGSQSVSRSLFGKMVPAGEQAQFYGFMNLSGKISGALGPLLFGLVHEWTGEIRWAILSLLVLLVAGQALLFYVKEP